MPTDSYAFRVVGIEPKTDPAWHMASEMVHRAFWRAVVTFVLVQKDKELARGLDRYGEALYPIAESTRRKGRWRSYTGQGSAINPPLTPANRLSRTRNLFTGRAHADHAEFFWRIDTVSGKHWGRILGYHRDGAGNLPVRDVIGLSPRSLGVVKQQANRWWAAFKAGKAKVEAPRIHVPPAVERPKPKPAPKPAPKPTPTPTPAPRKIVATGRIDIEHATGFVGGTRAQVKAAIEAGTSTGFRQLPRWKSPIRVKAGR